LFLNYAWFNYLIIAERRLGFHQAKPVHLAQQ